MTHMQRFFKYKVYTHRLVTSEADSHIMSLETPEGTVGVIVCSAADSEFACEAEYNYFLDKLKTLYNITHVASLACVWHPDNITQNKYAVFNYMLSPTSK